MGTTLHEALTGQVWIRPEPPARGKSRRSRTVPQRPAGLSDRTERAIRRATDADATKRPTTCADFLKLLRNRPDDGGHAEAGHAHRRRRRRTRREFARYSLGMHGANCAIFTSVFDGDPPSSEVWLLVVQDVSVGRRRHLAGALLRAGYGLLHPTGERDRRGPRRVSVPVRVVHVKKDQHGHWMHGCEFFAPLEEAELNAFLNCMGKSEA